MIFYLKLNKWGYETYISFKRWLKVVELTNSDYYAVCDDKKVCEYILGFDSNAKILNSDRDGAKKYIDKVDLGNNERWENAFSAHMTPILHAKKNNFKSFWNIDADDTMLMIPDDKIVGTFKQLEEYADNNNINAFSLDMHRSNSNGWHWSFGVSYITNPDQWIKIFDTFDIEHWKMLRICYSSPFVNFDWFATYLKDMQLLNLQTFYIENMYFMHFCSPFEIGPRGLSFYKDGKIEYPIFKDIYKVDYLRLSELPIAKDVIKFDIGLEDEESRKAMAELMFYYEREKKCADAIFSDLKPRENYKKVLPKLIHKTKINIIFLVVENAKWKCQSLYDRFKADKRFNVKIVLSIGDVDVCGSPEHRKQKVLENKSFFDKRNMETEIGWDFETDTGIDIKTFEPDIIFYQEPYNISKNQDIRYASEFSLCMYVPYYINQSEEFNFMGTKPWHKQLFRFYVFDEYWKKITGLRLNDDSILRAVSHPILDNIPENLNGDYVVYAAHWSVGNKTGLSSFMENGKFMLEYAKSHPEINFVFTHHPTLEYNILDKGFYTKEEWDNYINEWKKSDIFLLMEIIMIYSQNLKC